MSYSIERHERDATPFLFIRRRVPMTELSATFGEVFPRVFAYVTGTGLAMAGRPTVVYREMSPGMATVEAGIPVAAASTGEGDIECGELPGGPAAVTIHRGPYERLGEAHAAVGAWVAEHGLEQAGPPWESYITDPTEEPDPEQWQTEVVWPLSS